MKYQHDNSKTIERGLGGCMTSFQSSIVRNLPVYQEPPEEYLRNWQNILYKRLIRQGYQMRDDTKPGIEKAVNCFAAWQIHDISVSVHKRQDDQPVYKPPKGFILCGGVGTGKTTLLKILAEPTKPERDGDSYFIRYRGAVCVSITDLVGSLLMDGRDFAEKFAKRYQKNVLIIDDLGQEGDMQYYGTKISKFVELIIERRYQFFERTGAMTVFATNLQPADLETFYDARTVSRLSAMIGATSGIVPFNGADWRKRA